MQEQERQDGQKESGANIVTSERLGIELCDLLGLDPGHTSSITITADKHDTLTAERLTAAIRRYEIRRAGEDAVIADESLEEACQEARSRRSAHNRGCAPSLMLRGRTGTA